jgi:hypothetical protein
MFQKATVLMRITTVFERSRVMFSFLKSIPDIANPSPKMILYLRLERSRITPKLPATGFIGLWGNYEWDIFAGRDGER